MYNTCQKKFFPMGLFRDVNEPVICNTSAIFVQNSYSGSKIMIYNIVTGKMKSITMKDKICFNFHADNNNVVFEYSGSKRGIAIVNIETFEITELQDIGPDVILGGSWNNYIVYRRGHNIVLFNIIDSTEKIIASCHHILGSPVVGSGTCAWLQVYKDKCCIVFYDIVKGTNLVISSPGLINKIYTIGENLAFQSCSNNLCSVCTYNISNGQLKKIFESYGWIELYKGKDGMLVWTVKKENQMEYLFDIWIYNTDDDSILKVLSDCKNAVIPTVSSKAVLWVDAKAEGDNLWIMSLI